jgi:hypothetical protein
MSTLRGDDEAEQLHMAFLRQALGVRKATSRAAILTETGRLPLCAAWMKQSLRFYNRIMKREEGDLARQAMCEDIHLGHTSSWSHQLIKCLKSINCQAVIDAILNYAPVDVAEGVGSLVDFHMAHLSRDLPARAPEISVRSQPDDAHKGFKLLTYHNWFKPENPLHAAGFICRLGARDRIAAVARFRIGSHNLGIETGRWSGQDENGMAKTRVCRSERICPCCTLRQRDDEMHVFHCPAYSDLRSTHLDADLALGDVFTDDESMRKCMNGEGLDPEVQQSRFWNKLALYLLAVESFRSRVMERKSGGPRTGSNFTGLQVEAVSFTPCRI